MMQVKLMNIITSFTELFTSALDLQTLYNVIYLCVFRFMNMGFATIFITTAYFINGNVIFANTKGYEVCKHFLE